jgi:hypothetical protein
MKRETAAFFLAGWKASDAQHMALHFLTMRKKKEFTTSRRQQPSSGRTS